MLELIKIVVLKGGIQLISCVRNMEITGDDPDDQPRVIGYYLHSPCIVETSKTKDGDLDASMQPWIPSTKDRVIPITAEQVITIVEPVDVMSEMYMKNILEPSLIAGEAEQNEKAKRIPTEKHTGISAVTEAALRMLESESESEAESEDSGEVKEEDVK